MQWNQPHPCTMKNSEVVVRNVISNLSSKKYIYVIRQGQVTDTSVASWVFQTRHGPDTGLSKATGDILRGLLGSSRYQNLVMYTNRGSENPRLKHILPYMTYIE